MFHTFLKCLLIEQENVYKNYKSFQMSIHLHLHIWFKLTVNFQKSPTWLVREQSHVLLKRCHLNHNLQTLLSVTWAQLFFSVSVHFRGGGGNSTKVRQCQKKKLKKRRDRWDGNLWHGRWVDVGNRRGKVKHSQAVVADWGDRH